MWRHHHHLLTAHRAPLFQGSVLWPGTTEGLVLHQQLGTFQVSLGGNNTAKEDFFDQGFNVKDVRPLRTKYRKIPLQSNYENREHLKYVWNVHCFLTNHKRDLQTAKVLKWFHYSRRHETTFFGHILFGNKFILS